MSKASELAAKIEARVAQITTANGFATNIGLSIFRGRPSVVESDLPCTLMFEGEDTVIEQKYSAVRLSQAYVIEGHVTLSEVEVLNPNDVAHAIVADLKRAIFNPNIDLEGDIKKGDLKYVGRNFGPREDGQANLAAGIEIKVEYNEDLSNP